ncbi:MAG: hypothetical protein DRG78_07470 [Epsilonproteobacteria bacterium]|nr:MAG: hypothetical protein DRG78_07470 [Campylobacterota bacterium]
MEHIEYDCSTCGVCCEFPWDIIVGKEEKNFHALKDYIMINKTNDYIMINNNGCIAFNKISRKCNIYDIRPDTCRNFKNTNANYKCLNLRSVNDLL